MNRGLSRFCCVPMPDAQTKKPSVVTLGFATDVVTPDLSSYLRPISDEPMPLAGPAPRDEDFV